MNRPFWFSLAGVTLLLTLIPAQDIVLTVNATRPLSIARSLNDPRTASCQLHSARGEIEHVIVIQFDNVHLTRDKPNIPSDLEQMPHLLNFIEQNGVMLGKNHTPLISHTGTDILTILTGVYPDRHGGAVSNGFRYFLPDGTTHFASTFTYWTDPLYDTTSPAAPVDTTYNILTAEGSNAPAPWVPFTRAGCNVGAVATSYLALHAFSIPQVFGNPSPEYAEWQSNPDLAFTDFVGIAIHCAAGAELCSADHHGRPDLLPAEPGGYDGFNALYGAKYVNPLLGGTGTDNLNLDDLFGQPIISRRSQTAGFPGFDISAQASLAYVAYMQEHGVPITFAFIADAHDKHPDGPSYGPGEAGYIAALKADDEAFDAFFKRLANDGIDQSNTLFVIVADENDHLVGGAPRNSCDGQITPCAYSHVQCPSAQVPICPADNVAALNVNMAGLLATQQGIPTPFQIHADVAPTLYIHGNPTPSDTLLTRPFERATTKLIAVNFYTGAVDNLTVGLADPVEMKLLHMITADPARTPTFTWFANPDYYVFLGNRDCNSPCVLEGPGSAWTHGDVTPDITRTWLGMVGPGIKTLGRDNTTWADHSDVRPTILALVGLKDDYVSDGRVLFEEFERFAIPPALDRDRELALELAEVYKKINAPVGRLGIRSLKLSTRALASGDSTGDGTYTYIETQLTDITSRRDRLAHRMLRQLHAAAFDDKSINPDRAGKLITKGKTLLKQVKQICDANKCP